MTRPGSEQPPARQRSEPTPSPERGPPAQPPGRPQPRPGSQPPQQQQQQQRRNPARTQAAGGSRPGEQQAALTRPSAVLDEAHLGDIEGALGRIRVDDEEVGRLHHR